MLEERKLANSKSAEKRLRQNEKKREQNHDYPGELSLICGLLFVYGFSILDGDMFTYGLEPVSFPAPRQRRRIVAKSRRGRARSSPFRGPADCATAICEATEVA